MLQILVEPGAKNSAALLIHNEVLSTERSKIPLTNNGVQETLKNPKKSN